MFIEASYTNNIHTGEKVCCCCYMGRFVSRFFSERVQENVVYFGLYEFPLNF